MTITSDDFHNFALVIEEQLIDNGEICFRTIMNRLYYYSLHKISQIMNLNLKNTAINSVHQEVENHVNTTYPRAAKLFRQLRRKRGRIDYDLSLNFSRDDVLEFKFQIEKLIGYLN